MDRSGGVPVVSDRRDPELKEQEEKERAIEEIIRDMKEDAGYEIEIKEIADAEINRKLGERLGSLLEEALLQRSVKYGHGQTRAASSTGNALAVALPDCSR